LVQKPVFALRATPGRQGGREVQPGGILEYFEDLNRTPNEVYRPKLLRRLKFGPIRLRSMSYARQEDFFGMGSIDIPVNPGKPFMIEPLANPFRLFLGLNLPKVKRAVPVKEPP
jgi:hypothetical protein